MKLKDAVDFCFANREAWISGSGAKTSRINANHILRILGPDLDTDDLVTEHFNLITEDLKAQGKSGSTINRITTCLTTVLDELKKNGFSVPAVSFKRQKEAKARACYFREEEVDHIIRMASRRGDHMLMHDSIVFSIKTGCRQGELLGLLASDIDIEKREIVFRDTKNGSDHWLRMHEDLVPILERRLELRIGQELFPWRDKDQLLRAFKNVVEFAGIPLGERVWHSLRHSVATWLCEKQVPIRTVMGVLNHKRVETTLRYAKASDKAVSAAIDLL